jgi:competence protein ComEA
VARSAGGADPAPPRFERHLVELNSAPQGEVEALPGVGRVLAARIAAERSVRPFESVEDLGRVPGVGESTITRIRPFARVAPR